MQQVFIIDERVEGLKASAEMASLAIHWPRCRHRDVITYLSYLTAREAKIRWPSRIISLNAPEKYARSRGITKSACRKSIVNIILRGLFGDTLAASPLLQRYQYGA